MKKNIVLIGFMGAGKSVVAKRLAKCLNTKLISTDNFIKVKGKKTIPQIFRLYGERYFRRLEEGAVSEIAKSKGVVIDCGGGVVLNRNNIRRLKKSGCVVYLKASREVIYKRLKGGKGRPLLSGRNPKARIRRLMAERKRLYERAADIAVDTSNETVKQVTDKILRLISYD